MRVLLALLFVMAVVGRVADSSPPRSSPPSAKTTKTPVVSDQEAIAKLKSLGAQVEVRDGSVVRIKFIGNNSHLGDSQLSFIGDLISLEQLSLS